jgi:hypothetical protein
MFNNLFSFPATSLHRQKTLAAFALAGTLISNSALAIDLSFSIDSITVTSKRVYGLDGSGNPTFTFPSDLGPSFSEHFSGTVTQSYVTGPAVTPIGSDGSTQTAAVTNYASGLVGSGTPATFELASIIGFPGNPIASQNTTFASFSYFQNFVSNPGSSYGLRGFDLNVVYNMPYSDVDLGNGLHAISGGGYGRYYELQDPIASAADVTLYDSSALESLFSIIRPGARVTYQEVGFRYEGTYTIDGSGQPIYNFTTYLGYDQSGAGTMNPVPEPETYAMLLAGLGLLGFAARRRTRNLPAIP